MGQIIVTTSGFAVFPAQAPANWPAAIAWPPTGNTTPNSSRTATLTDAEMLQLLTWIAAEHLPIPPNTVLPMPVTAGQLLVNWVGTFFDGTKAAVQRFFTTPATPPTPINLN